MFAALLLSLMLLLAPTARALGEDGLFVGTDPHLGIELVQLGEYGRLTLSSAGHGDMRYGRCRSNFKRDAKGIIAHSPFRASGTARCPESLRFSFTKAEDGRFLLHFEAGEGLAGESYLLFARLRPMERRFADLPPQAFDSLGLSPGMRRSEIEALLRQEGFLRNPLWSMRRAQPELFSQSLEVWSRGKAEDSPERGEESIAITYSAVFEAEPEGEGAAAEGREERALFLSRKWLIPFYDQPLAADLAKALAAKYGPTSSGLSTRFYDKSGRLQPQARLPFCAPDIHLQKVPLFVVQEGLRERREIAAACGSWVEIATKAAPQRPERIAELQIALYRSDLIYADYWQIWSRFEAEILRRDFFEEMARAGPKPDL